MFPVLAIIPALLLALLVALRPALGSAAITCDKVRVLVNGETIDTTETFPSGFSASPVMHRGDMRGTFIGRITITTAFTSGTSITPVFETSQDGVTWREWFAGAAITGSGTVVYEAEDDYGSPERFVRTSWTVAGSGIGVVTVRLHYAQIGPRGEFAPPGMPDRN